MRARQAAVEAVCGDPEVRRALAEMDGSPLVWEAEAAALVIDLVGAR